MLSQTFDFQPFLDTKISLFIYDPTMSGHARLSLQHLGFQQAEDHKVPRNYFEALKRLIPIIAGDSQLVLINLPPRPKPAAAKNEVVPIYQSVSETYTDIKTHLAQRNPEPLKLLSKTVPMIEVGDYLREKLVEVLFKFRVPAAFFMSTLAATSHLQGKRKEDQARENLEIHLQELTGYLAQYFRDKEELVALADEKLSEKDLTERKAAYDRLMDEADKFKQQGDYDAAIAKLRQAIETFPKDIEAFLESGRLYTRKREYNRALARFIQAEELFQEAPSPNREIGNLRLVQVQEKIEAGADPRSPEILELLDDAVKNYEDAQGKAVEMTERYPNDPDKGQPQNIAAIGQELLKWDLPAMLGPKHPAVRTLHALANKSTEGLDKVPLEELSTDQCLALGLQAVENRDVDLARKYYFHALKDKERYAQICTEINYLGIRLRNAGLIEAAIGVYQELIKHRPHNQGSVYWNLAIAQAQVKDPMAAAGYASRSLYIDPYIAREKEFYDSLTFDLVPIVLRLMKVMRLVVVQQKKIKPPPQLLKLYRTRDQLATLIAEKQRNQALKLFLALVSRAARFTLRPEFHADGAVVAFLKEVKPALARNPGQMAAVKTINAWLKQVAAHPVDARLSRFFKLCQAALRSIEDRADQHQASFFIGQALVVVPEAYFARPDFFARDTLPGLVFELARKFQYVDVKRFPKAQKAAPSKA
ncbi:MAG: hypothetical protein KKB20_03005 [Proteobacteria bacterium]|nr:hypothetical protein [Pseudomonadota bacterium]